MFLGNCYKKSILEPFLKIAGNVPRDCLQKIISLESVFGSTYLRAVLKQYTQDFMFIPGHPISKKRNTLMVWSEQLGKGRSNLTQPSKGPGYH